MNRTQKFLQNSISTAIYQVVVMLVGFVTPRVMLQYYGSELNGLVSSINQFITYLSVVEAGISGAAVYALYKPLAENDHGGISAIVSATKGFYYQVGFLFTGLILAMAAAYPFFVETSQLAPFAIAALVVVLGAKNFLEFFTLAKYRVLLTADQKTYVISNASSLYVVLQMVIVVVLAMLRANIVLVYTVAIVALLSRSFILMLYVRKHYPYVDYRAKPNKKALDKKWDALFLQVLGATQTGSPIIIATVFTSLAEVSIYSVYNMVFSGLNGILSIFMNGLSAGFGDVIVRKEKQTLQKAYQEFEFAYFMLVTVVYAVAAVMLIPFIRIYTAGITDADYIQPALAILFTLNGFLYNIKTPQGMLVIAAGMYKETRYRTLMQALIIVIGGVALAPFMGLTGILIASCLSNFYRCVDLMFFAPKYITQLPVRNSVMRALLAFGIFAAACVFAVAAEFNTPSIVSWVVYAVASALVVTVIAVALNFLFNREQFMGLLNRLKRMVKKA